jgi:hypothetical protein
MQKRPTGFRYPSGAGDVHGNQKLQRGEPSTDAAIDLKNDHRPARNLPPADRGGTGAGPGPPAPMHCRRTRSPNICQPATTGSWSSTPARRRQIPGRWSPWPVESVAGGVRGRWSPWPAGRPGADLIDSAPDPGSRIRVCRSCPEGCGSAAGRADCPGEQTARGERCARRVVRGVSGLRVDRWGGPRRRTAPDGCAIVGPGPGRTSEMDDRSGAIS